MISKQIFCRDEIISYPLESKDSFIQEIEAEVFLDNA
jgi:hypothetical protein